MFPSAHAIEETLQTFVRDLRTCTLVIRDIDDRKFARRDLICRVAKKIHGAPSSPLHRFSRRVAPYQANRLRYPANLEAAAPTNPANKPIPLGQV